MSNVRRLQIHPPLQRQSRHADKLAFLLIVFGSACSTTSAMSPAVSMRQVAAATDEWRAACDSRETKRITAQTAADAALWGTNLKAIAATPSAVAEYFKDARARSDARVVFGEQNIRVYGGFALNSGTCTFTGTRDGWFLLPLRPLSHSPMVWTLLAQPGHGRERVPDRSPGAGPLAGSASSGNRKPGSGDAVGCGTRGHGPSCGGGVEQRRPAAGQHQDLAGAHLAVHPAALMQGFEGSEQGRDQTKQPLFGRRLRSCRLAPTGCAPTARGAAP